LDFAEKGFNATTNPECTMQSLLKYIIQELPEPDVRYYADSDNDTTTSDDDDDDDNNTTKPPVHGPEFFENDKFSIAAVTVGYDSYLGRTCTGRILSGSVGINDSLTVIRRRADENIKGSGTTSEANTPLVTTPTSTVTGLFIFEGIERVPLKDTRAYAGDVITIAGIPDTIAVGDTLTSTNNPVVEPINTPPLAPPTLCMDFGANDGPLAGREGTHVASSKIRSRLMAETDNNVTLRVEKSTTDADKTVVYARGELQLGILVEQMRREGYEMIISPPRIITKTCPKTGQTLEPIEEVTIDVDSEYTGTVISALTGDRRGVLIEMSESSATDGKSQVVLEVPSRGLLGFSSEIATATKGSAIVNHLFLEDRPQQNLGTGLVKGKLISNDSGKATGYALTTISQRGVLFIEPGDEVYSGMIIGENAKPNDLEVNTIRAKDKTNMRTTAKDEKVSLAPPVRRTVEELIGYMVCPIQPNFAIQFIVCLFVFSTVWRFFSLFFFFFCFSRFSFYVPKTHTYTLFYYKGIR
jgi:GTP-binding protein